MISSYPSLLSELRRVLDSLERSNYSEALSKREKLEAEKLSKELIPKLQSLLKSKEK